MGRDTDACGAECPHGGVTPMSRDDYYIPDDPHALSRENELLSLENLFLKGRIRDLEQKLRRARDREGADREVKAEQARTPAPKAPEPAMQEARDK